MTDSPPSERRKLTAIVAADIAGYSRLMGIDEDHTITTLQFYRTEVFQPLISKHQGRLANTAGDSYLIEFPSATNAVQFALQVQRDISIRNEAVPDNLRIVYRLGINLGDVVSDGDDLLGDGVNIAARIEAQAEPGKICLSRSVRDQVRDRLDIELLDLGEIQVKNIARPVRIFQVGGAKLQNKSTIKGPFNTLNFVLFGLITVFVFSSWYWYIEDSDFEPVRVEEMHLALPAKPSIAVMPFEFIGSSEEDGAYLTDGLSENITTYLTEIRGLFVIGQKSTKSFSEKSDDVRAVASAFGVRYVLNGSLQKIGESLRVTANLVDAISGRQIWSSRFDRSITNWFSIQDDITLAVVGKVYGKAIAGEGNRRVATKNLQAFIYSLKGRDEQQAFTSTGNRKAREYLTEALKLDPGMMIANLRISFSHLMDARMGYSSNPSESLKLSEEYAIKALKEDPDDPTVYQYLAMIRIVQKMPKQALDYIGKALEKGEGDPGLLSAAAWVYKYAGKSNKALDLFTKAKRLQPVHEWWLIADEYGALIDAERYEKAIEYSSAYVAVAPSGLEPLFRVYTAIPVYFIKGENAAKQILSDALRENPQLSIKSFYAFDIAYVDRKFPEMRYQLLRKLGLPE